ncbi:MAG: sigma-70 family RNA polymerase sigma factor [Blastococcus sp.]
MDDDWLAQQFEEHRPRLRAVATRLLGSGSEADDAVQETWLRLSRTDPDSVENLGGWLTTVVGRVALNMLRSRSTRREEPLDGHPGDDRPWHGPDPADTAVLADSVGMALVVVLENLTPAERLAFVLHDLFDVPFDEIAPIVDRSPAAARQLASRARRRVQGSPPEGDTDPARRREVVAAFLAASQSGDFAGLLALLDPDVVLRADAAAVATGAEAMVRGAEAVAATFSGRARAARLALVDGVAQLVWSQGGAPRVVFAFTIADGTVTAIDLLADPALLGGLEVSAVDG